MKIAILGDSHFGAKKNDITFLESQLKFFKEVFFPYLDSEEIDTIVHCGDVYDNRNIINTYIMNEVESLLNNYFSYYNTYLLVGNHDSFYNSTIDVHSLKSFKHIRNINVIDDIEKITLGNKEVLFVPWQVDNEKFIKKVMDKNLHTDICFGHFEINGFNLNNKKVCDFGISPDIFFDNYKLTFSGHFHKRKILKRESEIVYVGNTNELTRIDLDQPKGFCVLDTDSMKYTFINNNVSIKHKLFTYPEKFSKEDIEGNIVDVIVDIGEDHDEAKFQSYMMSIDSCNPYNVDLKLLNNLDVKSKGNYKVQSTEELIDEYISDIKLGSENTKIKVNNKMLKLYKQCKQEE